MILSVGLQVAELESFYPRPCARGDIILACMYRTDQCFYPRPCARGDTTEMT